MKTAYLRYAIQRCCCCITGGTGTIGYKIDEDKFYHLDPLTAPLVLEAFQQYDNGERMVEIVNFLNEKNFLFGEKVSNMGQYAKNGGLRQ